MTICQMADVIASWFSPRELERAGSREPGGAGHWGHGGGQVTRTVSKPDRKTIEPQVTGNNRQTAALASGGPWW
jgi:hypothetical protein